VTKQTFVITDPHDRKQYPGTNIIASFGDQTERILLCAHWDTRAYADRDPDEKNHKTPILGAHDGASGVAVLLEVARVMKENPPPRGVDIVLFDGEDAGIEGQDETWCQGSRFFAQNKRFNYNPVYGILIDMVGDRDLNLPYEQYSYRFAPDLVKRIWGKAQDLGLSAFDFVPGYEVVDDHRELLRVGIPCVVIIDFDYPYWHTLEDTVDKCSPESLGIVGTLLLHLIYE
jgi:Zn-dependent M28 family amino/carboxypeptidase